MTVRRDRPPSTSFRGLSPQSSSQRALSLISVTAMNRKAYISQPPIPSRRSLPSSLAPPSTNLSALKTLTLAPSARQSARPTTAPPDPLPVASTLLLGRSLFPPRAGGTAKNIIVWFRLDLRLHDHPALTHAVEESQGGSVIPVYIFDPRKYGKTTFGFEKTGRYRANFLLQAITNLRQSLVSRGSNLVVREGRPEKILPQLARKLNASTVICHKEVLVPEGRLERTVHDALQKTGTNFIPLWSNTLYDISDLPFSIPKIPDVYTVFREAIQTSCTIRDPLSVPSSLPYLPNIKEGEIPSLSRLGLSPPPSSLDTPYFKGGEREALKKLSDFLDESKTPGNGRSIEVRLGADFSCRISPWLSFGCLSPRHVYCQLKKAPKACQTSTYFELVWRDFFRFITVKYTTHSLHRSSNSSLAAGSIA